MFISGHVFHSMYTQDYEKDSKWFCSTNPGSLLESDHDVMVYLGSNPSLD